jgi:hypothetical protein
MTKKEYDALLKAWNWLVVSPPRDFITLLVSAASRWERVKVRPDSARDFIRYRLSLGAMGSELSHDRMIGLTTEIHVGDYLRYKGKKFRWFMFKGEKHYVAGCPEMIVKLCELIAADNHPRTFRRVLEIFGKSRRYFSETKDRLKNGRSISNTGVFVEVNLSNNNTAVLCDVLHRYFGYDYAGTGGSFTTNLDCEA